MIQGDITPAPTRTLRVALVDDEPLALRRLRSEEHTSELQSH